MTCSGSLLQWALAGPYYGRRGSVFLGGQTCTMRQVCAHAARQGHLATLQWVQGRFHVEVGEIEKLPRWLVGQDEAKHRAERAQEWAQQICTQAASGGHLDVILWARANGYPWDKATTRAAAQEGHLHVLQHVRTLACPWDDDTTLAGVKHKHILRWIRGNEGPWPEAQLDDRVVAMTQGKYKTVDEYLTAKE